MLGFSVANQFKKDCKLLEKRRYDLNELFDVVLKIIIHRGIFFEVRKSRRKNFARSQAA
jgi:mRNA-degrading endonuclease YafQ of YafQ-DinJ toxin-antitoxin module